MANPKDWGAVPVEGPEKWGAVPVESAKSPGLGERIGQLGRGLAEGFAGGVEFVKEGLTPRLGGMDIPGMEKAAKRDVGLVEKVTGPLPEPGPQDTMGRYLRTGGQFLGNPLSYVGPGGPAIKALSAVGGAAGAQTAHEAGLGPIGEVAGAVIGGGIPRTTARAVPPAGIAKSQEQLMEAATSGYNHPVVEALEIKPSWAADTARGILSDNLEKFDPLTAPSTFGFVEKLKNLGRTTTKLKGLEGFETTEGAPVKVQDVKAIRDLLNDVAGNFNNPTDQKAAIKAIEGINEALGNIPAADVIKGDAKMASQILDEAGKNYGAAKRSERVTDAEYRAEHTAASTHSGTNANNAMRQAARSILLNKKKVAGLNDAEIKQLETVVDGTIPGNISRRVGKLFGDAGLGGFLGGAAGFAAAGGPVGAPVLPAIGMAARKIGEASTNRQVRKLDEMIRMRAPLSQKAPNKPNAVQRYIESLPPEWQQALRSLGTQATRPGGQ